MILLDEQYLFVHDREILAKDLANKSEEECYRILCGYKRGQEIVTISLATEDGIKWYNRTSMLVVVPLLFLLAGVKWLFTGQMYLDSWARKYKPVGVLYKMIGYGV